MRTKIRTTLGIASAFLTLALMASGCGVAGDNEDPLADGDVTVGPAEDKADHVSLPVTVVSADIGSWGQTESRRVIGSASSWRYYIGTEPPAGVDFNYYYVVVYSAGVKNTGGYAASFKTIKWSNYYSRLYITTSLSSPGSDCIVTMALTKPSVVAKIRKPYPRPYYTSYYKSDSVRSCGTTEPCTTLAMCVAGYTWSNTTCSCVPTGSSCTSDSQCVAVDNYCGGCNCLALNPGQTGPTCS